MGAEIFNEAERHRRKRGLQAARRPIGDRKCIKISVPTTEIRRYGSDKYNKIRMQHQRFWVFSVNPARNVGKIRQAGSLRTDPPWIYC